MLDERTIEDLIREEAYFISQTREKFGIGDKSPECATRDWLEAEEKIRHAHIKGAEDIISENVKGKLESY